MNNSKGLSQILYLIIAASVLMIAALSMVFMLDEGLSGIIEFGGDAGAVACERQASATCAGQVGTYDAPSSCITTDDQNENRLVPGADLVGVDNVDGYSEQDETITCAAD